MVVEVGWVTGFVVETEAMGIHQAGDGVCLCALDMYFRVVLAVGIA
jgi:hypothetical protein